MNEDHVAFSYLILAINKNDGDDNDPGWLLQNDYKGISSLFNPVYITGNCAEELKEQVSLSGGLSKEITMEAILGLSSQSEGDILVIANYSAMMTIRQYFRDAGYAEDYWKQD